MAAAKKKINKWAISVAMVVTVLAVWLSFRAVEWQVVRKTFAQANYFWVALALANSLFGVYAMGWRWRILLRPKEKIPMSSLFRLNIIGQYANILMPARTGEVVRAYIAARDSGISGGFILGTIAIERIFDFMVFLTLWLCMPSFFAFSKGQGISFLVFMLGGVAILLLAVFVFRPGPFINLTRWITKVLPERFREKVYLQIDNLSEAFVLLQKPMVFLAIAAITFALILNMFLTNLFMFQAFHFKLPLWAGLFLILVRQTGDLPPAMPGRIGIFEYTVILALAAFSVERSAALSFGIMLHIVAYVPKIILGSIYGVRLGLKDNPSPARERARTAGETK